MPRHRKGGIPIASRIKGITIQIGAETTGLQTALKNVNNQIRTTQSALKDVERLLKLDPGNTELLSQKQKLLAQAINETKEKLATLKTAAEQANEQLQKGEITQEQYDALQREIAETEAELTKLEKAAAAANTTLMKIGEVGSKMEKVGDTITNVGKKVSVASAAVAGLGAAAVKTTAEFDSQMSTVKSISGATAEEFDALRAKAIEMGSSTSFSATEAAQAMEYMSLAGWSTQDMLDGISGIMDAAAASGENLATTADIITDGLTAFGLSASDSAHFADVLVKTGNSANTTVSMMGETFKYAGAVCGSLGISIEDAAVATGLMGNAGIKASNAGTALRTGLTNLIKPTDQMAAAMEKYGVEVKTNADGSVNLMATMENLRAVLGGLDKTEQAAAISAIFGKNAMSGWSAIVNASESDFTYLTEAIYNADGAAQEAANIKLDNLSGQITILKSTLEGIAIQIGDILMPMVRSLVAKLQSWATWFSNLDTGTKELIVKIGLFVAALGPALVILGTVISKTGVALQAFSKLGIKITALISKSGGLTGALGKVGAAIGGISAPVVAVVAIIGTLVAAFITLWNTNEEFRSNIIAIWDGIRQKFAEFGQAITDRLNALGFDFQSITDVLKAIWNGFCEVLAPVFEGAFKVISAVLGTVLDVIVGLLDVFIGLFTGNWSQLWSGIKEIFSGIWDGIKGVFSAVLGALRGIADTFLGWFGTSWSEVWTGIKAFFEGIWNGITSFLSTAWETIKNVVSVGIQFIGAILEAAFDIITLPFRFIWENCKDTIVSVWNTIKTTVSTVINAVSRVVSTVMTAIQNTVSTIWTAISTKISTVVNAIKNTVSTVFNAIKTVASTVWNSIKTAIGTVVDGIKSKVTTVFDGVKNSVSSVFNSIKSTATSVWNGIKSAITTPIEAAKNTVKSALDKISSFFSGCKLQLPHIKLPHFSISGSFSISPPSVPHLSISWYKQGGIMTKPTVFGMNGMSLMAGGEAGAEAVLPLSAFYKELNSILASKLDMSSMEKYLAVIAANSGKGIYLDDGTLVGRLVPVIDGKLGKTQKLNERLAL